MFDSDQFELVESADGVEAYRRKFHDRVAPSGFPDKCDSNLMEWNANAELGADVLGYWKKWVSNFVLRIVLCDVSFLTVKECFALV